MSTAPLPRIPPPTADLDRAAAVAVHGALDGWLAGVASALVDLDAGANMLGNVNLSSDVAAAFMLWQAVSNSASVWSDSGDSNGRDRALDLQRSWSPVVSPAGEVLAPHLHDAIAFLDALVGRLHTSLAAQLAAACDQADKWVSLDRSLTQVTSLSNDLGLEVRNAASLTDEVAQTSRAAAPPPALAQRVAALAERLRHEAALRSTVLARLAVCETQIEALRQREAVVRELAATCRHKVQGAPPLAVPSIDALGPAPTVSDDRPWSAVGPEVTAWLHRLDRFGAALDEATRRFEAPLRERDELRGLVQSFRAKAAAAQLAEHPAIDTLYTTAKDVLWAAPCDLAAARAAVDEYVETVNQLIQGVLR